jgi:hypothetical protein
MFGVERKRLYGCDSTRQPSSTACLIEEVKEMVSIQSRSCERFQIVLTEMPTSKKWSRAEKLSLFSPIVAILGAAAAWGTFVVNKSNRQDSQTQAQQTELNEQIDSRVEKKVASVGEALRAKADDAAVKKDFGDLHKELAAGFDGIRSDIEKNNGLIRQTKEDLAKLNGRVDGIDKDVNLLLQKQLRAAADSPPAVLAAQIPNVYFLYQLAEQRNTQIPNETTNLLRGKLASVESSEPDFWQLAASVISRASANLIGRNLQTQGRITNTMSNNSLVGARVILDNIQFVNNVCDRCVIEYHGGPTITRNNRFTNCLFVISLQLQVPPEGGQKVVKTLLASNLRSVRSL